jgi:signal transduction histidine kinase
MMSVSLLELKAEEPEAVRRAAEVIRRNLDREAELIRGLSDVAQIVSGEVKMRREPLGLGALVEGVLGKLQDAAAERGVDLLRGPIPAASVETDSERAAQALETYLECLLASCETGERVSIEASEEGRCACIEAAVAAGAAGKARPAREQKGFAMRLLVAETLLERLGGDGERGASGFCVRLPLAGA